MITIKDYFIILKIRAGDTDAWEELVEKYYDKIVNYCRRRFFNNRTLAEDLTQDIFLKVIASIDSYKFTGSFFNYLFTIAVNTCNNYGKKRKFDESEFDEEYLTTESQKEPEQVVVDERRIRLQKAIDTLPDYQKEAIILKFFYDMKVKEIAKLAAVSIPTAQSRVNQGLKKLQKILDKEDFYFE